MIASGLVAATAYAAGDTGGATGCSPSPVTGGSSVHCTINVVNNNSTETRTYRVVYSLWDGGSRIDRRDVAKTLAPGGSFSDFFDRTTANSTHGGRVILNVYLKGQNVFSSKTPFTVCMGPNNKAGKAKKHCPEGS